MEDIWSSMRTAINRRSFMKNGLTASSVGLLANSSSVFADDDYEEQSGRLTRGGQRAAYRGRWYASRPAASVSARIL